MQNTTTIIRIPLEKLLPHPENPNRMSKQTFGKLKRHIAQSHNYEPLIVRKHPEIENCFEIINGHHRATVLKELGETFADCIIWNVDDDQARMLLATLNRLGGKDLLAAKIELIKNLSEKFNIKELTRLLPDTKQAIEKLKDITKPPQQITGNPNLFLNTLVFFLDDAQIKIVQTALEKAMPAEGGRSEKSARAITIIAQKYLNEPAGRQV